VTAKTQFDLPKGKNYVRLENLPRDLNPNTISINLPKTVSLMSVTPEIQTPRPYNANAEELRLQDELNRNNRKIQLISYQITLINKEKAKKVKKLDKKIYGKLKKTKTKNVAQLDELTAQYDKKIAATVSALASLEEQRKELLDRNKAIQEQINKGKPANTKTMGYDVVLELDNDTEQNIELAISYLVENAGWVPNYDIRAQSDKKMVEISYKGKIYQNTGQEWNDIKLAVSSYKPNYNTVRPVLNPLYATEHLQYQPPVYQGHTYSYDATTSAGAFAESATTLSNGNLYNYAPITVTENLYKVSELDVHLAETATWNAVANSPLSVIYELHKNHTIPSTMNPQHVFLDSKEVSADYVYHAVPSISSEVHLLAKVKAWNELNLMGGEAFLFLGDNFVGKTVINSQYMEDELPIALGTDERILVRRTRLAHKSENKMTGDDAEQDQEQSEYHAYEITYKNNMSFDVVLEILDQLPLSLTQRIKILDAEYEDAEFNPSTGALLWTRELDAGKSGKVVFSYKVVHDKSTLVQFKRG
jgi:uncharacterized protein (TIGR02231 family)